MKNVKSITIGKTVQTIGSKVFDECRSLQLIIVDEENQYITTVDNVLMNKEQTEIIQYPMRDSKTSYTIPSTVTTIRNSAFVDCYYLQSIDVDESNDNFTSINGVLFDKENKILLQYPSGNSQSRYIVPDGTTTIREKAFRYAQVESIIVARTVKSIEHYAFSSCIKLREVNYTSSTPLTSTGKKIFDGTPLVDTIKVPKAYEGSETFCGKQVYPTFIVGTCGNTVNWIVDDGSLFIYGHGEIY